LIIERINFMIKKTAPITYGEEKQTILNVLDYVLLLMNSKDIYKQYSTEKLNKFKKEVRESLAKIDKADTLKLCVGRLFEIIYTGLEDVILTGWEELEKELTKIHIHTNATQHSDLLYVKAKKNMRANHTTKELSCEI